MKRADRDGFAPGKLWSLWDMLHFPGERFAVAHCGLSKLSSEMYLYLSTGRLRVEADENSDKINQAHAREIRVIFEQADFPEIARNARNLETALADWPVNSGTIYEKVLRVLHSIEQDFANKILFAVHKDSFDPVEPFFGKEVFVAFSSANKDIDEAGKCLAFDRGTACVMHLMRVLEAGLKCLAKAVSVSEQNDWGAYIREIERELSSRMKSAGKRSDDERFYSEAVASFDALKRAYRNPSMHPEGFYSPDQAREVFQVAKSFMELLASRLKETTAA